MHLLRNDVAQAPVFLLQGQASKRELAKTLLAESVVSICMPRLVGLRPDDLLEVRRLIASNREGFAAHMQQLSGALDSLVRSGAKRPELEAVATDIVETTIVPDYLEFRRQLAATRLTGARRVLDPAGKLLEINSSPLTPSSGSIWGRWLGLIFGGVTDDANEAQTNKNQTFNLIRKIDERATKLAAI